jgi:predicted RecA/RadA family phage recombinase
MKGVYRGSLDKAEVIRYTHNADVEAGEVIVVGGVVLTALSAYDADAEGTYIYEGLFEFPKEDNLAINVLDRVYLDAVNEVITKTAAGNTPCGYCRKKAAATDTVVEIQLEFVSDYLDAGIVPAAVCVFSGNKQTAGGAASEDIAVAGMLETDIPVACLKDQGTNAVTLLQTAAKAGGGAVTCEFSADPGNDAIINLLVFRTAA